jgi:hypothetical protein
MPNSTSPGQLPSQPVLLPILNTALEHWAIWSRFSCKGTWGFVATSVEGEGSMRDGESLSESVPCLVPYTVMVGVVNAWLSRGVQSWAHLAYAFRISHLQMITVYRHQFAHYIDFHQ